VGCDATLALAGAWLARAQAASCGICTAVGVPADIASHEPQGRARL